MRNIFGASVVLSLVSGVVIFSSVRCSAPTVTSLLPPEPVGMREPASTTAGDFLRLQRIQCDSKNNKATLEFEGGAGFKLTQSVNHDGKRLLSVSSVYSRTPSEKYDRAIQYSSAPAWASWPGGFSTPNYASGPSASYPQYSSGPMPASHTIRSSGPLPVTVMFFNSNPWYSSFPKWQSGVSMVSFPQFASQPSSVSMLRYSSSIIASAPVPAWRDWPIENTVFDVTFNTRGISQAILRNKDGVKRYSESQNGRLNDPDLAIYALRTVQLSDMTMAAVSCCVGSL